MRGIADNARQIPSPRSLLHVPLSVQFPTLTVAAHLVGVGSGRQAKGKKGGKERKEEGNPHMAHPSTNRQIGMPPVATAPERGPPLLQERRHIRLTDSAGPTKHTF